MASSIRFLTVPYGTVSHFSGRSYTASSTGIVDVPFGDAQAIHGQALRIIETGITADRPVPDAGSVDRPPRLFYDQTLGATIAWTGSQWVTISDGNTA